MSSNNSIFGSGIVKTILCVLAGALYALADDKSGWLCMAVGLAVGLFLSLPSEFRSFLWNYKFYAIPAILFVFGFEFLALIILGSYIAWTQFAGATVRLVVLGIMLCVGFFFYTFLLG